MYKQNFNSFFLHHIWVANSSHFIVINIRTSPAHVNWDIFQVYVVSNVFWSTKQHFFHRALVEPRFDNFPSGLKKLLLIIYAPFKVGIEKLTYKTAHSHNCPFYFERKHIIALQQCNFQQQILLIRLLI